MDLNLGQIAFLVGVALYTLAAAATDLWSRRIPNALTVTAFATGLLYQGVFHGGAGLLDGLGGFAVGFAPLFVLWIVGSGGGGDAKLMGGLGVWLGGWMTFLVLATTAVCVVLHGGVMALWCFITKGIERKSREEPRDEGDPATNRRAGRRVIPFAVPVAVATWLVVVWQFPKLIDPPVETGPVATVAAVEEMP